MAFINSLARQIREQHGLTLEQMAAAADLAPSTVCRYEQGELEVSYRYARALMLATNDLRLIKHFDPSIILEPVNRPAAGNGRRPKRTPPAAVPAAPHELVHEEIQAVRECSDSALDVERIARDGRVDASDDLHIGNLLKHHERVRAAFARTEAALLHLREQAGRKGGTS